MSSDSPELADRVAIFLGPTLPLAEARALLPNAWYCPPVQCGDILGLMRLREAPRTIAIIDGVFENVAAVWHKEILYALRRGCRVYGAASMGALRASELARHGMIGVGRIFEQYRDSILTDDDDVAVLHGRHEWRYTVLTDAMVNIQATLSRALLEGVVERETAQAVLEAAGRCFYRERVLTELCQRLAEAAPRAEAERLRQLERWIRDGGYVDQKREDARSLLRRLAHPHDEPLERDVPDPDPPVFTAFLRNLQSFVASRPLSFDADWLPDEERLARQCRILGPVYLLTRRVALSLAFLDACARSDAWRPAAADDTLLFEPGELPARFCEEHDLPDEAGPEFLAHQRWLGGYVRAAEERLEGEDAPRPSRVDDLLRLFGFYGAGPGLITDLVRLLARTWRVLESFLDRSPMDFTADNRAILEFAASLNRELGVGSQAQLDGWRAHNGLSDPRAYASFVAFAFKYSRCMTPLATNALPFCRIDVDRPWFADAMRVCGVYGELKRRLRQPARLCDEVLADWRQLPDPQREVRAHACDLVGFAEVERTVAQIAIANSDEVPHG